MPEIGVSFRSAAPRFTRPGHKTPALIRRYDNCLADCPHTWQHMRASYFVYILASGRNGTLYVGVTNDLVRRMSEHKGKLVPGFTRRYGVDKLVYFEEYASILEARARERAVKRWPRVEARTDREGESAVARLNR